MTLRSRGGTASAVLILMWVMGWTPSCRDRSATGGDDGREGTGTIARDAPNLIFRYADPQTGRFVSATSVAEVPEGVRRKVIIMDPNQPGFPPPGRVAVVDLTADTSAGYAYRLADRATVESELMQASPLRKPLRIGAPGPSQPLASAQTVLYVSEGCPYCSKARLYLRDRGIAFVEKDLYRDPTAMGDLRSRAQAAGYRGDLSGVPILYARGQIVMGYRPDVYNKLFSGK